MIFCWHLCLSQQLYQPANGAVAHMSQVYFEGVFSPGASRYVLSIYGDSLQTTLLQEKKQAYPAFTSNPLAWSNTYYWHIKAYNPTGTEIEKSPVHSFSLVRKVHPIDVFDVRMKINRADSSLSTNDLIVLDYARGIFDRKGNLVWTVPEIKGLPNDRNQIRDLRVSEDGTITFLNGSSPVEIDFEGRILWRLPARYLMDKDTILFHHDFKKTKNGNYQVLGNRKVYRKVTGNYKAQDFQGDIFVKQIGDTIYKRSVTGLLMEFDPAGKLLWYWDSGPYLTDADLNYKKRLDSLPLFSSHMNAFSVNRQGTKAYMGFRDLNRIICLDLKTKKVEFSYGEKFPSGEASCYASFKGQHDAGITSRNTLLVFNNNNNQVGGTGAGSLMEFRADGKCSPDPLIWSFDLKFDTLTNGISVAAGNIDELENGNLLVCGGGMPRIFEVTKKKQIVWDAIVEGRQKGDSAWSKLPQYRAHWTPKLYLFHFLANTEKKAGELVTTVINTGTINDQYKIELLTEEGKVMQVKNSNTLKPDSLAYIRMKAPAKGNFQVRVSPLSKRAVPKVINLAN